VTGDFSYALVDLDYDMMQGFRVEHVKLLILSKTLVKMVVTQRTCHTPRKVLIRATLPSGQGRNQPSYPRVIKNTQHTSLRDLLVEVPCVGGKYFREITFEHESVTNERTIDKVTLTLDKRM
jgi:hypothetical protein